MKKRIVLVVLVLVLIFLVIIEYTDLGIKKEYTLEKKVGQLIITIPPLEPGKLKLNNQSILLKKYNKVTLDELFDKYHVSGFIYMNWINDIEGMNKEQIKNYTENLQKRSEIPLFISADIEGGEINRISRFYHIRTSQDYGSEYESIEDKKEFISNYKRDVKGLAKILKEIGINVNFAPVLDVEETLDDGVFSQYGRSYSTDYKTVSVLGPVYVSKLERGDVFSTIKHFPGHGHTNCDTFIKTCGVNLTKEEYKKDLIPFVEALKEKPSFVMVGLFNTPYDEENISILSKSVVSDLLRTQLGFDGVVITDDFMMGAVKNESRYKLTIGSLNAGVDMLLTTNVDDVPLIYGSIMDALRNGDLTEQRIDESFNRIMKLKKKIN